MKLYLVGVNFVCENWTNICTYLFQNTHSAFEVTDMPQSSFLRYRDEYMLVLKKKSNTLKIIQRVFFILNNILEDRKI